MTRIIAIVTLLVLPISTAVAQRGGFSRGGGGSMPEVGTKLPNIDAIDEQGERFSTSSLRGSYTVLVFGCLT